MVSQSSTLRVIPTPGGLDVIVIPAALAQAMEYRKLSVRSLAKMVGVKHASYNFV